MVDEHTLHHGETFFVITSGDSAPKKAIHVSYIIHEIDIYPANVWHT